MHRICPLRKAVCHACCEGVQVSASLLLLLVSAAVAAAALNRLTAAVKGHRRLGLLCTQLQQSHELSTLLHCCVWSSSALLCPEAQTQRAAACWQAQESKNAKHAPP